MRDNLIVFPEPPAGDTARLVTPALPVSLTSLIGREHEVQVLHALLLRPDVRLLTLTGTAGVGKTRLALEVARDLVHDFADGVYVVSLAPLSDPAFVIAAIAHGLGLTESGSQPVLEQIKTSQHNKQQLLLLDNFEHVISAAPLLVELLEACPHLKLLVTSREVLRLRGERQFTVPPLALPDPSRLPDDRSLAHVPAVQLFLQRVQAIKSDFQLTTDNAAVIAEICLRLDGLPLAIELAAARIKLLPPQALLIRLSQRLTVLTSGSRDAPERQQTLRNTIAWSYQLLDAQEQCLFRRLSVFVGGCTLQAIEAIGADLDDEVGRVFEGVASLLDKSLLQQIEQEGEEPRLMMLETLREFGLEALEASGEMETTQHAHARYYLALVEEAEPELAGPRQAMWLERLEREYGNLRAAMLWSLDQAEDGKEMALRFGGTLRRFWFMRGHLSEGWTFLERALLGSEGVAASMRAKALIAAARVAFSQSDYARADVLCERSLVLCRELGDTRGIAYTLYLLGQVAMQRGSLATARSLLEESLEFYRELVDTEQVASNLYDLAVTVRIQGEYARARDLCEESLAMERALGNTWGIICSLLLSAQLLLESQGDPASIRSLLEEGLALTREWGDKELNAWCCELSGWFPLCQGDAGAARPLLEKSLALYREGGERQHIAELLSLLAKVAVVQSDHVSARALYEESLKVAREIGYQVQIAPCLEGLATVVVAQGEPARAARLWGMAGALRQASGAPLPPVERADYERAVASARAQLGEEAFVAAWAQGRTMTPEQVLAASEPTMLATTSPTEASSTLPRKASTTYPNDLTARELDVLVLLAQGMTSAQIAEQLVIGVVTVNFHVRSIYGKLGVTSRSAATRYAVEHHLV